MPHARHAGAPPTEPFEAIMEKGEAALGGGSLAEAERLFGQATVLKPSSAPAWHGKGRAFALQEEWEKALRCFAIATKFAANDGNAWAGLALAHGKLGERPKAVEALAKAEALGADAARVAEARAAL
jgi:tetratricopeptide (TPR) repeat protein